MFIIFTFLFLFAGGLVYLIYLPFKKRLIKNGRLTQQKSKLINTFYFFLVILISAYFILEALFPGKNFYEEEFKKVTLRHIPESAEFIKKDASYPDLHGDYCSSSQIRLSKSQYQELLQEIKADTLMIKEKEIIFSAELNKTLENKKANKIIHSYTRRQIERKGNDYYYIGFYDDGQTIFVNICVM